jgi:phospholipid/cholesterol/gamma-HCH transport system substrate-binding protein/paraquat-inducible protein B
MSDEKRYFKVGAFVLTGALLIGSCTVILGGGDYFAEKVVIETYFDESVQGLEVGSPVKLRGVQLGSVSSIGFVQDAYTFPTEEQALKYGSKVRVLMDLTSQSQNGDEDARRYQLQEMIAKGLRLRLTSIGITGTSFIEADYMDAERFPLMDIMWRPKHYYIPSAPSTIATISTAAERIFARLEDTEIEKLVQNLDRLAVSLNASVDEFDVARFQRNIDAVLADARATVAGVNRLVEGSSYDLQATLDNTRVAAENLRDLTDTLKSYPSLLVLGEPPEPPAVSAK